MHGSNGLTFTMSRWWAPAANADGAATTVYDDDWLAGQVFESYQWDTSLTFWSATRNYSTWTTTQTGVTPRYSAMPADTIRKWRTTLQQSRLRDGTAAAPVWRDTRVDTIFDGYGRQTSTTSTGFADVAGDETCAQTWYINGTAPPAATGSPGWMNAVAQTANFDRLGGQTTNCWATGGVPTSVSKFFYGSNAGTETSDATTQSVGAGFAPVATTSMVRSKNDDLVGSWSFTHSTIDAAGRTTSSTDAVGNTVTFGFDSTYGYPDRAFYPVSVNGNPLMTQVALRPGDGQPSQTTDQNGHVTYYC